MPINDFSFNFLIECLNKISNKYIDNICILMGEFNIDLLKSYASNVTSKSFEVMTCFLFIIFSNLHVLLVYPQHL